MKEEIPRNANQIKRIKMDQKPTDKTNYLKKWSKTHAYTCYKLITVN